MPAPRRHSDRHRHRTTTHQQPNITRKQQKNDTTTIPASMRVRPTTSHIRLHLGTIRQIPKPRHNNTNSARENHATLLYARYITQFHHTDTKTNRTENTTTMKVKVKKLTPTAVIPYKTYQDDFCYDITATSCEQISPGIYRYGTGIALEIDDTPHTYPSDLVDLGLTIRPRSSIYKTGMILSNSLGTIDFGYRNEIMAVFYHVIPTLPPYQVGDRIAQYTSTSPRKSNSSPPTSSPPPPEDSKATAPQANNPTHTHHQAPCHPPPSMTRGLFHFHKPQ